MPMRFRNPIIPGFHPDPSICRVGDDYYLVTSSFEYFPGVPLFHSRDLVHWEQIGHVLTRASQLPLTGRPSSQGIWAPTLRYHAGIFYLITTNVGGGGNFYVTTRDITGTWSEPIWLHDRGIDPSLFFGEDGTVYYTREERTPPSICQGTLDLATGQLQEPMREIARGTGGNNPEGPHLYQRGEWYYLMLAEGGTHLGHMETVARSRSPWGPFTFAPHNPILSHRYRSYHPIAATGHADLVETPTGEWWAVFLGIRRGQGQAFHHLGREVFLAPVTWSAEGWPSIGASGMVELEMDGPALPRQPVPTKPPRDDFTGDRLSYDWNFRRNPPPDSWNLTERPGWLRLHGVAAALDDSDPQAWVGRRQVHMVMQASVLLDFHPHVASDEAGMTIYQNEEYHVDLGVRLDDDQGRQVFVRRRIGDLSTIVAEYGLSRDASVILTITADADLYTCSFAFSDTPAQVHHLATAGTRFVSSELAGGFTGVFIALYATGHGQPSSVPADFDWFAYRGEEKT